MREINRARHAVPIPSSSKLLKTLEPGAFRHPANAKLNQKEGRL